MEKNKFIDTLYENVINKVLLGIDSRNKETVCKEYYNVLIDRYSSINFDNLNSEEYNLLLNNFIELENYEWGDMGVEQKLSALIQDEALNKLSSLSAKANTYAKDYIDNNKTIDDETYNTIVNGFNKLKEKVAEYNDKLAERYIIEGMADLDFANGKRIMPSSRLEGYEKKNKINL